MKKLFCILLALLLLVGCTPKEEIIIEDEEEHTFIVYGLSGPTSMGMVGLLDNSEENETQIELTVCSDASEVTAAIASDSCDIAMLPANAAATLYNKSGGFTVVAINTLGVLYVVTDSTKETVTSIEDLAGKTVVLTGEGTTPEYALRYVLQQYGIEDQVTLEFKSSAAEVATALASELNAIALLPQPYVTSALAQNTNLEIALSLTEEWDKVTDDSSLVTGVTVIRNEILETYPNQVAAFLEEYAESVEYVNSNPETASETIVELGIVGNTTIATTAIPYCNLVCITGDEMKTTLEGYLQTLLDFNADSIGGQLPDEDYYY